jgi:hypothetical protein
MKDDARIEKATRRLQGSVMGVGYILAGVFCFFLMYKVGGGVFTAYQAGKASPTCPLCQ